MTVWPINTHATLSHDYPKYKWATGFGKFRKLAWRGKRELWVFHDTCLGSQINFCDLSFSWVQKTYLILWCSLCSKLDDGSASVMRRCHLISNTNHTAAMVRHPRKYNLTKTGHIISVVHTGCLSSSFLEKIWYTVEPVSWEVVALPKGHTFNHFFWLKFVIKSCLFPLSWWIPSINTTYCTRVRWNVTRRSDVSATWYVLIKVFI